MPTTDDRGADYRAATADCPVDGDGCPTADELVALADGALRGPRREAVLALVASCARCADAARFARASAGPIGDAVAAAGLDAPTAGAAAAARRAPRWLPGSVAAILVAGMLLAYLPRDGEEPLRGAASAIEPADGAALSAAPARFAWSGAGAACGVTVRDASGARVWRSATTLDGSAVVPADVRAGLRPGTYLWRLECGGVARGTYRFTLR
jgi:hypothetical protein